MSLQRLRLRQSILLRQLRRRRVRGGRGCEAVRRMRPDQSGHPVKNSSKTFKNSSSDLDGYLIIPPFLHRFSLDKKENSSRMFRKFGWLEEYKKLNQGLVGGSSEVKRSLTEFDQFFWSAMISLLCFQNCYLVNENTLAVVLVRWWFVLLLLLEWELSMIKSGGFVGLRKKGRKSSQLE